jgi:hypothetical protein
MGVRVFSPPVTSRHPLALRDQGGRGGRDPGAPERLVQGEVFAAERLYGTVQGTGTPVVTKRKEFR